MTHIEADQCQVGAICVQVVQALLVEDAALRLSLRLLDRTCVTQGFLKLPQGRQDVLAKRLTQTQEQSENK